MAINAAALDMAIRRFPAVLRAFRNDVTGALDPATVDAIRWEYRLVMAEQGVHWAKVVQ